MFLCVLIFCPALLSGLSLVIVSLKASCWKFIFRESACVLSHVWLFWKPMDCSPPGSSVHGIFQARILEQFATSFFRGSSRPRDWTHVYHISCTARWILYHWATWEVRQLSWVQLKKESERGSEDIRWNMVIVVLARVSEENGALLKIMLMQFTFEHLLLSACSQAWP